MNITIVIKPCAETSMLERQGRVRAWFENGNVEMEAADYISPEKFVVTGENFPWRHFACLLVEAWKSSNAKLPDNFIPKKRIPQEVISALESSSDDDCRQILKALCENKYLSATKPKTTTTLTRKRISEPEW